MPEKTEEQYSCWSCGLMFASELHAKRASISGCPRCDSYQVGPHKDTTATEEEVKQAEQDFGWYPPEK